MDLRANTAVDVLIGPFVDKTDGNTTEDGLTLTQAEIKLSKNGQALAQKNDNTNAAFDDDGYYNCELDSTDLNTEGNLVLIVHQSANALPVRHEYNVLSEAAWDSLYAAKDDGFMDVNIKTVGRSDTQETEANNLESACSNYSATRGLTGTAVPAVAADGAGGLPISDAGGLDLDAILADTNELQTDNIPGTLATIAAYVDTEVGAIKAVTDALTAAAAGKLESIFSGTGIADDVDIQMRSLTITNDAGVGVAVTGTTIGLDINGTAGVGVDIDGTTHGLTATGANGNGVGATGGTNGHGLACVGVGAGDAIYAFAGGTGSGGNFTGGASGGEGIIAQAASGNSVGLYCAGYGTGAGLYTEGGATGHGLQAKGGATSGAGFYGSAQNNDDAGMELVKNGTGKDLDADETDDILADTNELQTDNVPGSLATIAGYIDTEVGAIKAVTDALPDAGALTTIGTDTARLTAARAGALTDLIDGGRLDLLIDAIKVITDALTAAAAAKLALSAAGIVTGAAEAGTLSTTQMTTNLAEATNDHYIGRVIVWTSGVLDGQGSDITDYAGANGLLTFTAVTEAPSATDTFVVL